MQWKPLVRKCVDAWLRSLSLSLSISLEKTQVVRKLKTGNTSCVNTEGECESAERQSDTGWETQCDSVHLLLPHSVHWM